MRKRKKPNRPDRNCLGKIRFFSKADQDFLAQYECPLWPKSSMLAEGEMANQKVF